MDDASKGESSSVNFSLDKPVEFLPWDGLSSKATNWMNDSD